MYAVVPSVGGRCIVDFDQTSWTMVLAGTVMSLRYAMNQGSGGQLQATSDASLFDDGRYSVLNKTKDETFMCK